MIPGKKHRRLSLPFMEKLKKFQFGIKHKAYLALPAHEDKSHLGNFTERNHT